MNAADPTGSAWYLFRDGQQHGPITREEVSKLVELQRLRQTDLLWREGFAEWMELAAIPELKPRLSAPRPPPASRLTQQPVATHASTLFSQGYASQVPQVAEQGAAALDETPTTLALVSYILLIVPFFPLPLIGLIMALVNTDAKPEWLATHYRWQWRTSVKGIPFAILGLVTVAFGVGFLILLGVFVWSVVRLVKGISALNRKEPIANYRTWGW